MLLRLLAPFVPYVTEEAWSWWHDDSVHASPWPEPAWVGPPAESEPAVGADGLALASTVIGAIRKAKSDARLSMRAPVRLVRVSGDPAQVEAVAAIAPDLRSAGNVAELRLEPSSAPALAIDVTLDGA